MYRMSWGFDIEKPIRCYEGDELSYINSEQELVNKIKFLNMRQTFFVIYPGETTDRCSYYVKKIIVKNGGRYANYYYPSAGCEIEYLELYRNNIINSLGMYIRKWKNNPISFYWDLNIFYNSWKYPSVFELMQGTVGKNRIQNKFLCNSKKCVILHSNDYDRIIRMKNNANYISDDMPKGKYAVFIDQFMEGHSDFKKMGIKPPLSSKERYYTELNDFFEVIEKKYGYKVVIALHPKAEYSENPFGERKTYLYRTDELIAGAELCLFHNSTCFALILALRKPFIQFITTDLWKDQIQRERIFRYEKLGVSKIYDINMGITKIDSYIFTYNPEMHEKFLSMIMYPEGNSDELNMEKICRFVSKLR